MSTGPVARLPHLGGRTDPPQAGLRAGALPRDGRVPQLRHQLHDHLDPRGVPDVVHDRLRARWPGRGDLGLAARRAHEHDHRALDGGDRVGVPDRGRPLLLGVEARGPGLGLGDGLVQPDRPDRRHGRDRVRARDLRAGALRLLVRLLGAHGRLVRASFELSTTSCTRSCWRGVLVNMFNIRHHVRC